MRAGISRRPGNTAHAGTGELDLDVALVAVGDGVELDAQVLGQREGEPQRVVVEVLDDEGAVDHGGAGTGGVPGGAESAGREVVAEDELRVAGAAVAARDLGEEIAGDEQRERQGGAHRAGVRSGR